MLVTVNIVADLGRFWQKKSIWEKNDLRKTEFFPPKSAEIGQNAYRNQHPWGRTVGSTLGMLFLLKFKIKFGRELRYSISFAFSIKI